jgi:glutamyl-tRNA reductase
MTELARLSGFSELVYLGTCNRVEFYYRVDGPHHQRNLLFHLRSSLADLTDGACRLPADDELYRHRGQGAARHLFRVTAALDSMMVGEAQIMGQAKQAHEQAHEMGLLSGFLDQTFHEAFHLAKRIRSETELARRPVSLVTLVERRLHDHLAVTSTPVLILGAGEMAAQALRLIRAADGERRVLVANRTPERAEALTADDPMAGSLSLDSVLLEPPRVGLVIAATSAETQILSKDHLAAIRTAVPRDEQVLVIDLAMPPNVDPDSSAVDGVEIHGIEAMREEADRNRTLRLEEMDRCETMVEHQLTILRRRALDRALSPAARTLHTALTGVAGRAMQHALSKDLAHLEDGDRARVERMVRDMVKRMVQVPLRGLKGASLAHSSAVIDGFIQGIDDTKERGVNGGHGESGRSSNLSSTDERAPVETGRTEGT